MNNEQTKSNEVFKLTYTKLNGKTKDYFILIMDYVYNTTNNTGRLLAMTKNGYRSFLLSGIQSMTSKL